MSTVMGRTIHDFDTLRYLNPGAEAVWVYAVADALARPDWKDRGLLDTSIVTIRFDNGAMATAEASFQASYGYDKTTPRVTGQDARAALAIALAAIRSVQDGAPVPVAG